MICCLTIFDEKEIGASAKARHRRGTASSENCPFTAPERFFDSTKGGSSPLSYWVDELMEQSHAIVAAVATAKKLAWIAWAVLTKEDRYKPTALTTA